MAYFSEEVTFLVTVTNICPTTVITSSVQLTQVEVDIKDKDAFIYTFEEWAMNQIVCGQLKYTLTRKDGGIMHSFIKFDEASRTISIKAERPEDVGQYQIVLTGYIPKKSLSVNLIVQVTYKCKDAKPEPSKQMSDIIYRLGPEEKIFLLPSWTSSISDCGIIQLKYTANGGSLPPYLTLDEDANSLKIQSDNEKLDGIILKF